MSYGYPDGCTQATHDRAFNELGPSPAELAAEADAQNDFDRDYPEPEEMISKRDAATVLRVFLRLEQKLTEAFREERDEDAAALARMVGALHYKVFGVAYTELGAR